MRSAEISRDLAGLLAVACLLAGCGPRPVSTIATVHFENRTTEEVTESAGILQARFAEMAPTLTSSVTATVSGQNVVLEFRGEAPPDETIREYATQGVFRIYASNSPLQFLVTDLDVESATARQDEAGPALSLSVTERAGQRLQNHTSRNLGQVLVTSWNGKEQSRNRIGGVFSRQFLTTGMDRETAIRMMIMLRYGRLPVAPQKIEIVHPSA